MYRCHIHVSLSRHVSSGEVRTKQTKSNGAEEEDGLATDADRNPGDTPRSRQLVSREPRSHRFSQGQASPVSSAGPGAAPPSQEPGRCAYSAWVATGDLDTASPEGKEGW